MLRLTAYRISSNPYATRSYIIHESIAYYTITSAQCVRTDVDLPLSYSHAETLSRYDAEAAAAAVEDDAAYNVSIDSIAVPCEKSSHRCIQIGRAPSNTYVVTCPRMPRFALRLVHDSTGDGGGFYVKAAGFDQTNTLFLPPTRTLLGDTDYSTSNPVLLVSGVRTETCQVNVTDAVVVSIRGWIYSPSSLLLYRRHTLVPGDGILVGLTLFVVS